MNFTEAYAAMKKGYTVSKPGLGWSMRMEKDKFIKQYSPRAHYPIVEVGVGMMHLFAEEDWFVCEKNFVASNKVVIPFKKLCTIAQAPVQCHPGDAGFDLTCTAAGMLDCGVFIFSSGLAFAFPEGIHAELRARSSVYKTGMILANGVGTIDQGYTGEVKAVFYKITAGVIAPYIVGERFAQLVIVGAKADDIVFQEVQELPSTERKDGGFGSTGC